MLNIEQEPAQYRARPRKNLLLEFGLKETIIALFSSLNRSLCKGTNKRAEMQEKDKVFFFAFSSESTFHEVKSMLSILTIFIFDEWDVVIVLLKHVLGDLKTLVWLDTGFLSKGDGTINPIVMPILSFAGFGIVNSAREWVQVW